MSRTCTKCKNFIPDEEDLGVVAAKYPTCKKCWAEWKEYQIMVMNEMKLDMSMLDHRKLLKKHDLNEEEFNRLVKVVSTYCYSGIIRESKKVIDDLYEFKLKSIRKLTHLPSSN